MVKGISKRVIVVKAPYGSIFDEAIFILKKDSAASDIDAEEILKEASAAADAYVRMNCTGRRKKPKLPFIILGAVACLVTVLLFILF